MKSEEQARIEAEKKLKLQAEALSEMETNLEAEVQARAEAEEKLKAETAARLKAEDESRAMAEQVEIRDSLARKAVCECCGKDGFSEKQLFRIDSGQMVCPDCLREMIR